jgi:hypothetical protein
MIFANCDSWWRLRWIARGRPKATDVIQYHSVYRFDGKLGWSVVPGLERHPMAAGATVSTNSKGIRGSREYGYVKSAEVLRVVAIGDSFTFGEEVSDEATYPAYVGTLMSGAEVLNLGVGGYGHDQMALYLAMEGVKYRPDVVVLGFVGGDMERNTLRFRDYWKPRFSLVGGRLTLDSDVVPTIDETTRREFWRLKCLDLLGIALSRGEDLVGLGRRAERGITERLLDRIVEDAMACDARAVFVYLAFGEEITGDKPSDDEAFFRTYCESRVSWYNGRLTCMDTRPEFRRQVRAGQRFRGGHTEGHYDPAGHLLVAREIVKHLTATVLR